MVFFDFKGFEISGKTIVIQTPSIIRKQLGVDISPKDILFSSKGFYDGNYKGATYRLSKDYNNDNYMHYIVTFADGTEIKSTDSYIDGKYVAGVPKKTDSVEELEILLRQEIDKRENK